MRRTHVALTCATRFGSYSGWISYSFLETSGAYSVNTTPSGDGGEVGLSSHHSSQDGIDLPDQKWEAVLFMDRS